MVIDLFNAFILLANVAAALIAFYLIKESDFTRNMGKLFMWGVWIGSIGLLAQASRNGMYLFSHISPSDNELPFWALKDCGLCMIVLALLVKLLQQKRVKS